MDGREVQEPGAPGVETPRTGPADTDREGRPSPKRGGRESAARDEAKGEFQSGQGQELRQPQPKPEQPQQAATTYRVLFVLRMVRPDILDRPAAAASMIEPAEPPAARIESVRER